MEDDAGERAFLFQRLHVVLVELHPTDDGQFAEFGDHVAVVPDEAGARLAEDIAHAIDGLEGDEDGHVVEGAVRGRVVAALAGGEVLVDVRQVPGDDAFPPELRLGEREQLVAGVLAQVADGDVVAADVGRRGQELERLIDRVRTFDRGRQMVYSSRSQDARSPPARRRRRRSPGSRR